MKYSSAGLLGLLEAPAAASPFLRLRADNTTGNVTDFPDIEPTADLEWTPCFQDMPGNITCVNLEVPLDYEKPDAGKTVVAFVKVAAAQQPAKGDVLVNPGGPGGSGVSLAIGGSRNRLEKMLGPQWNLVGMDPRGVNNSGPSLACFPPATRIQYAKQFREAFDPKSPVALERVYEEAGAFGEFCSNVLSDEVDYANTPATANDMLHYIELEAESQGKKKAEAMLNYYGVSYGSVLGTTFAQLWPDRIGHMIIDGVMESQDYYFGDWSSSLKQMDEAVVGFFKQCFEAGSKCAFFKDDSSVDAMVKRFDAILKGLEEKPITISDPYWVQFPTSVSDMDLRTVFLQKLYKSFKFFPTFAAQLALLEERNATWFSLELGKGMMPIPESAGLIPKYGLEVSKYYVGCNDIAGRFNISSFERFEEHVEWHAHLSKYLGTAWATVMTLQCRNLRFSPPESQVFPGYKKLETSNPILFTNNKIDPVTPSAEEMHKYFAESVVMYQDAIGHGLIMANSSCVDEHINQYMDNWGLPEHNTLCKTDSQPFDHAPNLSKRDFVYDDDAWL